MLLRKKHLIDVIVNHKYLRTSLIATAGHLAKMSSSSTTAESSGSSNCPNDITKSTIAVAQMRATSDKVGNMQQVRELMTKAKAQQAKFLFLPECCDYVGENRKQTLELAESLDGDTMKEYQALAKQYNMWLSLGGIHESILDENACKTDKIYNAHVLVDSNGQIISVYRKLHLFDVETPEFRFLESSVVKGGTKLGLPVATPIGQLGLQICYDMRFAESSILLRKMGAEILAYPSAFAYSTGKAHWEILLRARAIENQCFVVAAAQKGFHNDKRQSWGHAMVVNPWGKLLADAGGETELSIVTANIDLSTLKPIRASMPCFEHRRDDVYSLTGMHLGTVEPKQDRNFANNIINKDTIFFESEHCYAFTNLRCVVEGHVLVSTKRETPRLNGLNCAELTDLFATVCMLQRMLGAYYGTSSATVTVQDGKNAGQTVPHVHFHVMQRRPGDFGHNDQIYVQLDDRCDNQNDRTMAERIIEAQNYRSFLKTQLEKL